MDLRQYDPAIARWTSIDPKTHFEYSTYSAFDNNPVFYSDPSGADSQSFEDYWNEQVAYDKAWLNSIDGRSAPIQDKKRFVMSQTSVHGYIDFEPDKDARGNELSVGKQIIVESIKQTNKYLIINSQGKSSFLYETTEKIIKTILSSDGSTVTSTLTTIDKSGSHYNNLKIKGRPEEIALKETDLSGYHLKTLNVLTNELNVSNSSFAASYRDKVLTWGPWAGGATVSDIVQWGAAGFKVNSMPVIGISAAATWGSISSTKPSQMRLNLYYGNQKKYASPFQIFKKH